MSVKPLDWIRGAKEIRLEASWPDLSDGTRICEGCDKTVKRGGTITKEHVDIITSAGAQEWRELVLCSECYCQIYDMMKELRNRAKRKPEWKNAPPGDISTLDIDDLDREWRAVTWGLRAARDVASGEAEAEGSMFTAEDYNHQILESIESIKEALAELEEFMLWLLTEIAKERKEKGE